MEKEFDRELSQKYCPRFAKLAVDKGFITSAQAKKALSAQMDDNISNRPHRLKGRILLDDQRQPVEHFYSKGEDKNHQQYIKKIQCFL